MKRKATLIFFLFGPFLTILLSAVSQAQLPIPTGQFGIGLSTLDWTDSARPETQSRKEGEKRRLLVYLFYPTDKQASGVRADYFPHLMEVEAFEERFGKDFFKASYGSSYKIIASLKSHAIENAKPTAKNHRFPVLIFSHGGGIPVLYYTAIIENLVSHGYVVAAVEHRYDGATVVFPDGHIITQSGWDQDEKRTKKEQAEFHGERIRTGALDNSFVLDQLQRLNSGDLTGGPQQLKGRLDTNRVGTLGHSFGGKVSIASGHEDKRFRICYNLDGGLDAGSTYGSLNQPVAAMFGDNRRPHKPGESAEAFAKMRTSRDRYVNMLKAEHAGAVEGSFLLLVDSPAFSHFSYYDFPNVQTEAPPWQATREQWEHNQRIILDSTVAVFNEHLSSKQSKPVADLLKQFPEIAMEPIRETKAAGH